MRVWPSPDEERLLKAALLTDERAIEAWKEVRPAIDVDRLDGAVIAVLPHLRANLIALGVEDELFGLFKGIHRFTWARTQMLLAAAAPTIAALEEAGIETMLVKGAAMVADGRLDAGRRVMSDVDVVVRPERRTEAIALLGDRGYVPLDGAAPWYVDRYVPRVWGSYGFHDARLQQIDLHWHVLHGSRQPGADDDFWAAAEPIELLGVATRALCPTDELLAVLAGGLRWNLVPTYRWVIDAAVIARGTFGPVDYDRLARQVRRRRLGAAIAPALRYLRDVAELPVPAPWTRAGIVERLEQRAIERPPSRQGRLGRAIVLHQQIVRATAPLGRPVSPRVRWAAERVRRAGRTAVHAIVIGDEPTGVAMEPVALGVPLDFSEADVVARYAADGLWRNEPGGAWMAGGETRLRLPLAEPPRGPLILRLRLASFTGVRQRIEVTANGAAVGRLEVDGTVEESLLIPGEAVAPVIELRLRTPDALVAAEHGLEDDRRLGLFLRTLELAGPAALPLEPDAPGFADGWSDLEAAHGGTGRWTLGETARLLVHVPDDRPELELGAVAFLGRRPSVAVDVLADGAHAATLTYEPATADVPRRVALPPGDVLVELRVAEPRSPRDEGLGDDARPLGLFVQRLG